MDELVTWLREQIAQVRQIAKDGIVRKSHGDEWGVGEGRILSWSNRDEQDTEVIGGGKPIVQCNYEYGGPMIAAHIAEHDPRAVLAQCDAHEAILNGYAKLVADDAATRYGDPDARSAFCAYEEVVLPALALAYQHRPGYREEWRPS